MLTLKAGSEGNNTENVYSVQRLVAKVEGTVARLASFCGTHEVTYMYTCTYTKLLNKHSVYIEIRI